MANLDPNTWYQVYNNDSGPAYGLFVAFPNPPPYGAVFLSPFNQTSTNQQWQILHAPGQSGPYLLRSSYLGPTILWALLRRQGPAVEPTAAQCPTWYPPTSQTTQPNGHLDRGRTAAFICGRLPMVLQLDRSHQRYCICDRTCSAVMVA